MGRVLAYSDKTPVEMFAVGDNVLGIQGHPEYTSDILLNLIDRLVNNNTITVSSISAKLITISKHLRP
jgi:GMP synthase-like glutamine amidotransferase